jgi:hypothetical protein
MTDDRDTQTTQDQKPALPRQWIVPIRLAVYVALAACAAYLYFNYQDMEWTELLILLPIIMVAAMVELDCKMSNRYWEEQDKAARNNS